MQDLYDRRYTNDELEPAIHQGVDKKGLMDLTKLADILDSFIGEKKRESQRNKPELEEPNPLERESMEQMGET